MTITVSEGLRCCRSTLPKDCADAPKKSSTPHAPAASGVANAANEDEEAGERKSLIAAGTESADREDREEASRLQAENKELREQLELVRLREENEQLRAQLEIRRQVDQARPQPN